MPKLKRKKNGDYIIHKSGDTHPVNTFQVTDEGAEIVLSSGRDLRESFPDQLFYLLHDLDHLSTKGEDTGETGIDRIRNLDWATDELSVEERVNVATQVVEKHGVDQLLEGDAAEWMLSLTGDAAFNLKPLIEEIAEAAGYSYFTIEEYSERLTSNYDHLETALCAYLQMKGLRTKEYNSPEDSTGSNRIVGADGDFIYLDIGETPRPKYCIAGDIPDTVPEELNSKLVPVYAKSVVGDEVEPGQQMDPSGFAELASIEVRLDYDVDAGMVLPRGRLEDFPVELPPRSELTEQYEAFRVLQNHVDRVLSSPEADVEHGDKSACQKWYNHIKIRLQVGADGEDGLRSQQNTRVDHSATVYRDCYGDGEQITDFRCIEMSQPDESQRLNLYAFGPFDHGEQVEVPVAPESSEPLPVYPKSQQELDHALELLDEFSARPEA
jgi:hypothetical protein